MDQLSATAVCEVPEGAISCHQHHFTSGEVVDDQSAGEIQ